MISVRSGLRILVTTSPVDFRRGMDSLAMLVTDTLRGDPFCGDLFDRAWQARVAGGARMQRSAMKALRGLVQA